MRTGYVRLILLTALIWVGAGSSTAIAASPPPPEDIPAVSAYVELVPTSSGSRPTEGGPGGRAELPPDVGARVARDGGTDARLLNEIATSHAYGAPAGRRGSRGATPYSRVLPSERDQSGLGAGISVATDGSEGRLLVLGVLLLGITVGTAGTALYRRRGKLIAGA